MSGGICIGNPGDGQGFWIRYFEVQEIVSEGRTAPNAKPIAMYEILERNSGGERLTGGILGIEHVVSLRRAADAIELFIGKYEDEIGDEYVQSDPL